MEKTVEIHRVHPSNKNIVSKRTVIKVNEGDTIKNVKAKYLAESPKRDWIRIDLKHNGKILNDDAPVPPNGSTLTFESVIMTPEAKRRSIPTNKDHLPPYLNLENTTEFVADSERIFKSETARALVLKKKNDDEEEKKKKTRLPGRDLLYSYSIRTNGCVFRIIHRMEGDWTGESFNIRLENETPRMTEKSSEHFNTSIQFKR